MNAWKNTLVQWFDSEAFTAPVSDGGRGQIRWFRCLPFVLVHLGCLAVIWVGASTSAVVVCLLAFWLRMFAITAFYHRYFSHRSFKAGRAWQFVFAVLGNTAAQRGPLWWAAHHRQHHKHADDPADIHSPIAHGFWWSHVGWFMSDKGFATDYSVIKDLAKYPELRFLNRFDSLVPALFALLMFGLGELIEALWPASGTSGWQMLVWGFFISTVLLFHATFTINSLGHVWGKRRFATKDDSRNNFWLALLTLGEGWHNNHHRFAVSARQGFYWWEIDVSYLLLKFMARLGIVHDLNPVPQRILDEGRKAKKSS
ncbi:MAG: acyl-CoA desaturase [Oleiphilaceae bacterium]|nr:acyl-CoA desaturase [Oleiphilaceae bacterium]